MLKAAGLVLEQHTERRWQGFHPWIFSMIKTPIDKLAKDSECQVKILQASFFSI